MKRKNFSLPHLFGFLAWMIMFVPVVGAQQIRFIATVSSTRVAQNTVFEVQFELQNARGSDFRPPSFEGFKVVGGPAIGSSTTIINGAVSQSQTWSYSLLAIRQGKFTIGSGSVVAGRKKRTSSALSIEVVAPKEIASPSGAEDHTAVLLRAEIPEGPFYPGQQILLRYHLLFRENVQTVSTLSEDDYADFFVQHFNLIPDEGTFETIDGVTYTSRVVKAIALFAHQSGTFIIDPMLMSVGINAPFPGMYGFFTMRRIQDIQVASEPLTITVQPLPPGAPDGFTGAVGQYALETIPVKTNITTDEALIFRIRITGDGDARRWDLPVAVTDGPFDTYEPRVIDDQMADAGSRVDHVRLGEYQLIPDTAGVYSVFVPFTYFDPATGRYATISGDTLHASVAQGSLKTKSHSANDTTALYELSPMQVRNVMLRDKFWTSIPHLLLFGLILAGSTWSCWKSWHAKQRESVPAAEKTRKLAAGKAYQRLAALHGESDRMSSKDFFETATEIYSTFLQERFSIPASELDEAGVSRHLEQSEFPEEILQGARTFFHQCLAVRYGGVPGGFTREEMLDTCQRIIRQLAA